MDMVKRLEDIEDPTAATSADRQEHQELAEKLQGLDLGACAPAVLHVRGVSRLTILAVLHQMRWTQTVSSNS